jgi:DNA-binding transcriptional LysR family regulator
MRLPSLTTDQVLAFVELARAGRIRRAADALGITEQGVRNRLIALETQLGVELYRKGRGARRAAGLTPQGQRFLPHAIALVDRTAELYRVCNVDAGPAEVRIVASQYLTRYLLIDVLRAFNDVEPAVHVRVSTMHEADVTAAIERDPEVAFGLAAPYESSPALAYEDLFALGWSLVTPPGHMLAGKRRVPLSDITRHPLILYERGSTGRQHVLDAFEERRLVPRVTLETTSTETVISMVEAGLGVAIVPLLPSGAVTRGRDVVVRPLADEVRAIHSGLVTRRGETIGEAALRLLEAIRTTARGGAPAGRSAGRPLRRRAGRPA